ncbi:hypothetical protein B0A54_00355 [Friedmanniomyces endolithicus]|uniref:Uncharacterized protein n=1 Tax=Friedmanniomyces endolithicus TaxID=329885 RepID=A0A4U0VK79_9PEZI|nr:hypothetical protein B0A54_00355 [Friedmanniomyces endolithicus]
MPRSDEAAAWFSAVYRAVQEIPPGKVTSYGHIAFVATGIPGAGGAARQEAALSQEGVEVSRGNLGERMIDLSVYGWFPRRLPSDVSDDEGE